MPMIILLSYDINLIYKTLERIFYLSKTFGEKIRSFEMKELYDRIKNSFPFKKESYFLCMSIDYLFKAVATSTAQATVQPTIGLLPMPRNPIIST